MAAGYIVVQLDARDGTTAWGVWTGTAFSSFTAGAPELQNAAFYTSLVDGRAVEGALQAQYPEREIALLDGDQGITMDATYVAAPPPVPAPPPAPAPV